MGEIKYPILVIEKGDAKCVHYWDAENRIAFFDDIPENYPRYTEGVFDSVEEYLERTRVMVEDEGWTVVEDRRDEVEDGAWS